MDSPRPAILVVDDDDRLRQLLRRFLREQGFLVMTADGAEQARARLAWFRFDLVVLDVMMPGESGFELLASLQDEKPAPVLMLSAMGESEDRICGLETGAEDYLVKPFEPKELVLRIRTILRREGKPAAPRTVAFGQHQFDLASSQLKRGGEVIYLTTGEAALLKLLAEQIGKPVSREELSRQLPGAPNERAVDVQVTRLRKKIEESEGRPVYLQTVRGAGYVLYA